MIQFSLNRRRKFLNSFVFANAISDTSWEKHGGPMCCINFCNASEENFATLSDRSTSRLKECIEQWQNLDGEQQEIANRLKKRLLSPRIMVNCRAQHIRTTPTAPCSLVGGIPHIHGISGNYLQEATKQFWHITLYLLCPDDEVIKECVSFM